MYLALYESFSQTLLLHEWWASHWLLTVVVAGALGDACGSVLRLPAEMVRGSRGVVVACCASPLRWHGAVEG